MQNAKCKMQNGRCERNVPRWETPLWYAAFALLAFLIGCVQIEDPDIWWHLRTGQLIWERGEVPRTDWFTYTNPHSPWIDLHWGFQLVAAGLWSVGGVTALVLTKSLLAAGTFLLAMTAVRRQWPAWQTVACWLPAVLIFSGRNQVRPEMFSLLFLAAELAVLFHVRARPRLVWLLPAIQVLWINVHALFVLGLVLWGCFVVGETARRCLSQSADSDSEAPRAALRRRALVTLLMFAAAVVNPYGFEGARFPLTLLTRLEGPDHAFYSQFSGEFRGLPEFVARYGFGGLFRNLTTFMLVVLFLLTGLSFAPRAMRGRLDFYRIAIFVLFAWLGWKANRNAVLFALVASIVLRANVGEWLATRAAAAHHLRLGRVITAAAIGVLLAGVPFDMLSLLQPAELPRWFGLGEVSQAFCHDAAEFLGRPGMPRRCYAIDEGAAAVYIFHNGPERKVFADARLEVNTRATLERYLAIEGQIIAGDPDLFDSLTAGIEPDADGAIEAPAILISLPYLASNPALQQGLARLKQYRRVYVDDCAVVFLETSHAEAMGLPELRPQR
jgi:hypothetical protein